jgi:phenylacetate-CoA ligase
MTEDIARVTPSCECGMGGQPVSDIEGRMGDFVYTPSGKIISPTLMEFCMRNVRNAKKVMVEQDDIKMLTVHFYPDREFSQDEADDFVHVARELTDNEIEIRTVVHPEPPPKTIKYRFVLSRIARQSHWNKALGSNNPTH